MEVQGASTTSGGTAAYTYSWTPSGGTNAGASSLAAGSYTVTSTDANGCTTTATVIISQPTILTLAIQSSTNVNCNGGADGSASITATGGTVTYPQV
ncbi:MAG: hypothetical protein IPP51_03300 [Bacteroidetes bacterium]|nr:hypothetical protein [Bacteroidota bacterium]